MTHSPAKVLAELLTEDSDSLFTDPTLKLAWPLYTSSMPDGSGVAANVGCVYDTAGRLDARLLANGVELWSYGVQLKIRAGVYADGWTKAKLLSDLLSLMHNATVVIGSNSYLIECFINTSSVLFIGYDESRRPSFTINGLVMVAETT